MTRSLIFSITIGTVLFSSCQRQESRFSFDEEAESYSYSFNLLPDSIKPPEVKILSDLPPPRKLDNLKSKTEVLISEYGLQIPEPIKYSVESGLPSKQLSGLAVDNQGYLWINGPGFISRFDGENFENYYPRNLDNSLINSKIFVDSKNTLWVLTGKEIQLFDGQSFKKIHLPEVDDPFAFLGILEDKQGSIWINGAKGVFRIINEKVTYYSSITKNESDKDFFVFKELVEDKKGRIIVKLDNGFFFFNGETLEALEVFPGESIFDSNLLMADSQDRLWVVRLKDNLNEIGFIIDGEFNPIIYSSSQNIKIIENDKGGLWIYSGDLLSSYYSGTLTSYSTASLGVDRIDDMVIDNSNSLWFASNDGLTRINPELLQVLKGIEEDQFFYPSISLDSSGTLFITDNLYNTIRVKDHVRESLKIYEKINSSRNHYIMTDSKENTWIGTASTDYDNNDLNLIKYDGEDFYAFGHTLIPSLRGILGIQEDKSGRMIFYGNGVSIFDGNQIIEFGIEQGIPGLIVSAIFDSQGKLWLGTRDEGVFAYSGDSILHINVKNGLPNNYINDILEDPNQNIWLATDGGLCRFNGKGLSCFNQTNGLESNIVTGISLDRKNQLLWVNTGAGISALPFEMLDSKNIQFKSFSGKNGFKGIEGASSRTVIRFDSGGGIWTNSSFGLSRLDYEKLKDLKIPQLQLKNIRLNNQDVYWSLFDQMVDSMALVNEITLKSGEKIDQELVEGQFNLFKNISFTGLGKGGFIPQNLELPYKNNSITFEFSSISPSFGEFTEYRYKLEGYEENWSPLGQQNEAYFGNISEGEYTFLLEAFSPFGVKNELSYSFKVLPPWYRTWWAYIGYLIILGFVGYRFHLFQKAKTIEKAQKEAREKELAQAKEIEKAYKELKSTQAQLIQSEKMASLGELTAGIAHEIQNPLNFVNNFSEVSGELIDEAQGEIEKGDLEEIKFILQDLKDNLSKINHHGKRAGSIVKGMLEHSRKSEGKKELTDLNQLADECLRLSFHGLRAKDKTFSADFKTDFDSDLPKLEVVSQDMGRVLLNLINNAFYAVNEKAKGNIEGYKPEVIVSTKKTNSGIEISVSDNGSGIPDSIKDKIFQPFFTTKPTGSGTGLGLSLSYDIVKAHGGTLEVESEEGKGTVLTIKLTN
ncbi:sensor histidine kinase [Algoriphagus sp. oki45]|uniref:ATP-binding protein n=1 Tax=Algoriphagus sp. oki45 TaxID=3067294 RepID=UPI0027F3C9E9|nr:sensor histidine kinase [Algoriphagus sp. oki45]